MTALFSFPVIALIALILPSSTADHFVDPKLLDVAEIHRLERKISQSYLLKHNFLRCFEDGDFANMTEAASIFALNHYVYSKNFIHYLELVASKIESKEIRQPILENIDEELGNYEDEDIETLTTMGIEEDWYNKIPHKYLSRRFFESLGIEADSFPVLEANSNIDTDLERQMKMEAANSKGAVQQDCTVCADSASASVSSASSAATTTTTTTTTGTTTTATTTSSESPGTVFTRYMIDLYRHSNPCESLAIIGFAIEETVSRLYDFIWKGLQHHTPLTGDKIVFFPLHILIDDGHADLLKLGFKHYLQSNSSLCQNAESVIDDVLTRRIQMYDDVRLLIENKQGYQCKRPYSQEAKDAEAEAEAEVEPYPQPQFKQDISENSNNNDDNVAVTMAVDVDSAVKDAQQQTLKHNVLGDPQWSLLDKMALGARILARQGHGQTLSGQITCRTPRGMMVNPYGKPLELVGKRDFLEIDNALNVLQGDGFANKATRFHFHVYAKRADIKCIIHTHPPFTSALALLGEELFISHMDTMAFYEEVQYLADWPGIPFGDEEGDIISGVLGSDHYSALLAHHGLIVGGRSIEEAVYRAFFFERAAKMQLDAMAAVGGDMTRLKKTKPALSRKARDWRISRGPVAAHFNGWAQIALQETPDFLL